MKLSQFSFYDFHFDAGQILIGMENFYCFLDLPITAEQSAELNFGPGSQGFMFEKKPENACLSLKYLRNKN